MSQSGQLRPFMPEKLMSGMTGVKAEQTLLIVATAVKKSTKWALKDW
jgi:hypothetical protein